MKQRYEYETVKIGSQQNRGPGVIDDMAQDGWQLVETLGIKGTSSYLIFERPASETVRDSEDNSGGDRHE